MMMMMMMTATLLVVHGTESGRDVVKARAHSTITYWSTHQHESLHCFRSMWSSRRRNRQTDREGPVDRGTGIWQRL